MIRRIRGYYYSNAYNTEKFFSQKISVNSTKILNFEIIMVKFFLIATIFFSPFVYGQSLDGVMNIGFGSSPEVVKTIMLARPGCFLNTQKSNSNYLFFDGVSFAGRPTLFVSFKFFGSKLYSASIYIRPAFEQKLEKLYLELKSELEEKYFKATNYAKVPLGLKWEFKNKTFKETIRNSITMEVTEDKNIKLTYVDGLLILPILNAEKVKNNSDY